VTQVNGKLERSGAGIRGHLQKITERYKARLENVLQWLNAVETARDRVRVLRSEHAALKRVVESEKADSKDIFNADDVEDEDDEGTDQLTAESMEGMIKMIEERIKHKDLASIAIVRELTRLDKEIEVNTGRAHGSNNQEHDSDRTSTISHQTDPTNPASENSGLRASIAPTTATTAATTSASTSSQPVQVKKEYNAAIATARATLASLYAASLGEAEEDEARKKQLREECKDAERELDELRTKLRQERTKALHNGEFVINFVSRYFTVFPSSHTISPLFRIT